MNVTVTLLDGPDGIGDADVSGGLRSIVHRRRAGRARRVAGEVEHGAGLGLAVPSPLMIEFAGHVGASTPDNASAHVQWIVTAVLYQPFAFGDVVGAPDSVGAVLSTLMPLTVAVAVLPARSAAVPVTDWPAP